MIDFRFNTLQEAVNFCTASNINIYTGIGLVRSEITGEVISIIVEVPSE
jgi:hypothetical protein